MNRWFENVCNLAVVVARVRCWRQGVDGGEGGALCSCNVCSFRDAFVEWDCSLLPYGSLGQTTFVAIRPPWALSLVTATVVQRQKQLVRRGVNNAQNEPAAKAIFRRQEKKQYVLASFAALDIFGTRQRCVSADSRHAPPWKLQPKLDRLPKGKFSSLCLHGAHRSVMLSGKPFDAAARHNAWCKM